MLNKLLKIGNRNFVMMYYLFMLKK